MAAAPAAKHPDLHLSGRVISASACIPYELSRLLDGTWQINPRRGNSALFDSFSYLGKSSAWNHTVVGWTGEIYPAKPRQSQIQQFSNLEDIRSGTYNVQLNGFTGPNARQTSQGKSCDPRTHVLTVSSRERKTLEELLATNSSNSKIVPVWLGDRQASNLLQNSDNELQLRDQGRWRRYAERHLYNVFHYGHQTFDNDEQRAATWSDYVTLNRAIADKIIEIYKPGDLIFVHDYHLMLVPTMLRGQLPNIYVGFFLHIPFPSSEYVRELPERKDLLNGMVDADVLTFQTLGFARHFSATCERILDKATTADETENEQAANFRLTRSEVIPIGIDGRAISNMAFQDAEVEQELSQLRNIYAGKKVVIGRDRLETVRGVSQKLEAFEKFLELYPEWRKRVVLIQITGPVDTSDERKNLKYESLVSSLVSRINGKYGSIDHEPVRYYPQYFSMKQYSALLRLADVGLITSIRDGMNTTGLEFVICQEGNYSPLILSEFSGTANVLSKAIHINPWDYRNVAERLKECLEMPHHEKQAMHEQLYNQIMENSSRAWSEKLITSLCSSIAKRKQPGALPTLSPAVLRDRYRNTSTRLLMFDYDGTLSRIEQHPDAAIPTQQTLQALEKLVEDTQNQVWIVSGRDLTFLQTHLGHIHNLGLSAEHGCFIRVPGRTEWTNLAANMDMTWQRIVRTNFENTTRVVSGSWIETKRVALTWHYRFADNYAQGEAEASKCKALLEETVSRDYNVDVLAGKANLEVRPRSLNKGYVAQRLVEELTAAKGRQADFVLCFGDDQTDEDMFKALLISNLSKEAVFTCTVGPKSKQTLAAYTLEGPEDVIGAIVGLF